MLRSCSDSRFQNLSIKGIILFAALASFSILCGCVALADKTAGSASGTSESDDKTKVIASIFAPYDLARQVGGDYAEVSMLVPPGSETHSFEPTPRDIVDLQECDVFIYVGGESDAWLDDLLSSIDTTDKRIVRLMDIVDTLEEVHIEGMQEDDEIVSDESDDEHGQGFEERRAEQD
ncbi:zinc ABC transporter substrate-binding protein, partial [Candidatus Saccharibacteria bacterium]|nr:zinc ABC transporter substrate-binding protein [Candidatus Saccharibacteria bacterium]